MLKNIIIAVVLIGGILLLTLFYKKSSFNLKSDTLVLQTPKNKVVYPYKSVKSDVKNFSNVSITQYTLTGNKEKLIYEVATINGLYEFNGNPKDIILKLFDAKNIKTLFSKNGLEAVEVTLANDKKINLFFLQTDNKKVEFLYGLSNSLFEKSIKELSGKDIKLHDRDIFLVSKPITMWSSKVNDIDGVIGSIDH
ncbi:MAG: hypothetical protein GXO60_07760 [Epsilonproteobacteria bacterium]|nr:hypothetical protein [Campylobacterota bacterium]